MLFKLWRAVADLLFPRCCEVCGRELLLDEKFLCLDCLAEIPLTYFWLIEENPARMALLGRARVEAVCSLFYYTDSYKKLVHSFKYRSNVKLGMWLGEMLGSKIPFPADYIIPVPLHWRKEWKRGYNQSKIIAKGVCKGIMRNCICEAGISGDKTGNVPIVLNGLLKRRAFTRTQTQKDRAHRWQNVSDAFTIDSKAALKYNLSGKKVLILDDVFTTGATLDACANLLLEHFDCKVYIATLAYVE
ncbi:MAG: ComF family protein [Bacteroidales bacterium]|nr:ComF family protein [Bacteroidales bacterium]